MPIVILVLTFAISVVSIQSSRIQLINIAASAAREASRGTTDQEVSQSIESDYIETKLKFFDSEEYICVDLVLNKTIFWLGKIDLIERQCARKYGL